MAHLQRHSLFPEFDEAIGSLTGAAYGSQR